MFLVYVFMFLVLFIPLMGQRPVGGTCFPTLTFKKINLHQRKFERNFIIFGILNNFMNHF